MRHANEYEICKWIWNMKITYDTLIDMRHEPFILLHPQNRVSNLQFNTELEHVNILHANEYETCKWHMWHWLIWDMKLVYYPSFYEDISNSRRPYEYETFKWIRACKWIWCMQMNIKHENDIWHIDSY